MKGRWQGVNPAYKLLLGRSFSGSAAVGQTVASCFAS
jgi:hypothetical protein